MDKNEHRDMLLRPIFDREILSLADDNDGYIRTELGEGAGNLRTFLGDIRQYGLPRTAEQRYKAFKYLYSVASVEDMKKILQDPVWRGTAMAVFSGFLPASTVNSLYRGIVWDEVHAEAEKQFREELEEERRKNRTGSEELVLLRADLKAQQAADTELWNTVSALEKEITELNRKLRVASEREGRLVQDLREYRTMAVAREVEEYRLGLLRQTFADDPEYLASMGMEPPEQPEDYYPDQDDIPF